MTGFRGWLGWAVMGSILAACSGTTPAGAGAATGGEPPGSGGSGDGAGTTAVGGNGGEMVVPTGASGSASAGANGGGNGGATSGGAGGAASAGAAGAAGTGTSTGGTPPSCLAPPVIGKVQGWAAVDGMNQATTDGGGNATPVTVTTLDDFKKAVAGTIPAVVYVKGVFEPAGIPIGSNKTIVGLCGAEVHGHLGLSHSVNVIVANLKIVGYGVGDCSKDPAFDPAVGCSSGADAVSVSSASHHIWFDHCDISDGTDGNLDINAGSDFVTISWTKFHYTLRSDTGGNDSTGASGHRFSNLIGSGDMVPEDVGHLNVTFHHDWWADNVNQRMPRTRNGKIHVVNNLYSSKGDSYCTNAGYQTHLLVENNVYQGVKNPLSPDANGDMLARSNLFIDTLGTTSANGTGFMPPYSYAPETTDALAAAITSGAGPH